MVPQFRRYSHIHLSCMLTGSEPKAREVAAAIANTPQSFTPCLLISAIFNTGAHVPVDSNKLTIVFRVSLSTVAYSESKLRFHSRHIEHLTPPSNGSRECELFALRFLFSFVLCGEAACPSIHQCVETASLEEIAHS